MAPETAVEATGFRVYEEETTVKHLNPVSKRKPLLALNEGQFDLSQLIGCLRDSVKKQALQCIGVFFYGSDGKTCCGS